MSMLTPRGHGARPLRRRRGSLRPVLVGLLLVGALTAAGWYAWGWYADGSSDEVRARPRPTCPAPSPTPTVVAASLVKVNVYNATDRRGLAARVARQLERRGFRVGKIDNDPAGRTVTGAEVRHSTTGADPARTVAAQVGEVVSVPDQRPGTSVDLVLGAGFTALLPSAEAEAALTPTPEPRPAGC